LTTLEAYERWAETYPPVAHNPVMRAEQSVVEPLLRRLRPRRALDVGSGSGRYLPILASAGAHTVGVDFSRAMLSRSNGARVCADAYALPFQSASFDVVNASLMAGDIADLDAWVRELSRVVGRGGHLVYSDFHPTWAEFGWRRTFETADGQRHDIAIQPHSVAQHLGAIGAAGLALAAIREPTLLDEREAAVEQFRRKWGNPPVVVMVHATKPS
jgi:malonyl-CoA O-methyltransferase